LTGQAAHIGLRFEHGKETSQKKRLLDYQQVARQVLDTIAPDADPKAIKPAKTPPPKRKQYAADIDRVAGEGMAQPQGKNAAAVALGRLCGLKCGKARAEKLSPAFLCKALEVRVLQPAVIIVICQELIPNGPTRVLGTMPFS
jgi:hypothetical protein